ncbi:MAG: hypothetical protein ACP5NZ_01915 [Nanobdellota archaeon]
MRDLEEQYAEGIEREGEIFLEGLQNKRDIGELEKEYSKKVKEIRRIYEKSLKKELDKERQSQEIKNKINLEGKEEKEFHVQNLKLEKSWGEKKQVEIASSSYMIKRRLKNGVYNLTPNFFIYLYYKTKRIVKDTSKEINNFLERNKERISRKVGEIFSYIKEGFLTVFLGLKKVVKIFKKKEKKEEKIISKENGAENNENSNK